jgi:hypothetical protein
VATAVVATAAGLELPKDDDEYCGLLLSEDLSCCCGVDGL